MGLLEFLVTGVSFDNRQEAVQSLHGGMALAGINYERTQQMSLRSVAALTKSLYRSNVI